MRRKRVFVDELLAQYADTPDACWEWTGSVNNRGYGLTHRGPRASSRAVTTHRVVYEQLVGPVPEGLELDHLCANKRCMNPRHLEPVTPRENMMRSDTIAARNAVKTHCPQGHAYTPDNLYIEGKRTRKCRVCCVARARAYRARKRVA